MKINIGLHLGISNASELRAGSGDLVKNRFLTLS